MKTLLEIVEEHHETHGFRVLRPQRNLCQIEPASGDGVEAIVEAVRKAILQIRPHLSNCSPMCVSGNRHCMTYIEVNPLAPEDRGAFFRQMREKVPSPPGQELNINVLSGKRLRYALSAPFDSSKVKPAPPTLADQVPIFA